MKKLFIAFFTLAILTGVAAFVSPSQKVYAAVPITCPDGYETTVGTPTQEAIQAACEHHQTGGPMNDDRESRAALSADCTEPTGLTKGNCGIVLYLTYAIDALSAVVGIVIVVMIAYSGVKYATSADNPQETSAAKAHIRDAIIALIAYIFMVAFLNWLIPGGLF